MSRTIGYAIFRQYNVTKRKILVERLCHSTTCDTPEGYYIPYQQRKSQSPLSDMSKVKTLDGKYGFNLGCVAKLANPRNLNPR